MDQHRFESHFSEEFQRHGELQVLRSLFPNKLFTTYEQAFTIKGEAWLPTQGRRYGKVLEYECKGRRATGDPWTSFSNTMSEILMVHHCLQRQKMYERSAYVCDGDDGVMRVPLGFDAEKFQSDMADLGFDIAINKKPMQELSFCSFAIGNSGPLRNPKDVLLKAGFSTKTIHTHHQRMEQARAVAVCMAYANNDAPIIGELAHCLFRLTEGYAAVLHCSTSSFHLDEMFHHLFDDVDWYQRFVSSKSLPFSSPSVSEFDRVTVHRVYGITPELQKVIEMRLAELNSIDIGILTGIEELDVIKP